MGSLIGSSLLVRAWGQISPVAEVGVPPNPASREEVPQHMYVGIWDFGDVDVVGHGELIAMDLASTRKESPAKPKSNRPRVSIFP